MFKATFDLRVDKAGNILSAFHMTTRVVVVEAKKAIIM